MRIYTVHAPPERGPEPEDYADRFVFVRDGFRWLAFLFPALWLIVNRTWLAFLGYMLLAAALAAAARIDGFESALLPLGVALNLIAGFEADSLKRWSLRRKGWRMVGIAAGRNETEAEHAFFSRYRQDAAALRGEVLRPREMVGLFPEVQR